DLLMQASGRSGRADTEGNVIIQAFNPEHYVLKSVLSQDYEYFYNIEMNYRSKMMYPPYSHIMEIIISDINTNRLNLSVDYLNNKLEEYEIKKFNPISLTKINNLNRIRILLLDKNIKTLLDCVWSIMDEYLKNSKLSKIKIDIDPLYLE
ncbi:MAG: hypothetical protein Q4F12_03755, partial [Erysipelotrichaceae bacterium]|nr:hypothetical protein [Erysipelotrichaceae bacterium]